MSAREELLLMWAVLSTICAVAFFAYWRICEHFYAKMRDGWRDSQEAHRVTLVRVDELATAKAERMVAEAALVDALKQGAKPEAKA